MPTTGAEAPDRTIRLETARLILRPLSLADAPAIERYASDWEVARHTSHIPHPYPAGAAAQWLVTRFAGTDQIEAPARGGAMAIDRRVLTPADRAARWPLPPGGLLLVAAVALIDADGRVLLARRPSNKPMAGLWEFPGGKVHDGETPERALIRELDEELGIDVEASCLAPFTFASHAYPDFHLLMPLYVCRKWSGIVSSREGQRLAWVRPARLGDYPMPPADQPLVAMPRDLL